MRRVIERTPAFVKTLIVLKSFGGASHRARKHKKAGQVNSSDNKKGNYHG
jgi:hypothetical protein